MATPHDPGTVYLLHFEEPIGNTASRTGYAQHYTGWAANLAARLAQHRVNSDVKIMEAVRRAGIGWSLARTWPGDRNRERQIKVQGGAARHCPVCRNQPAAAAEVTVQAPPPSRPYHRHVAPESELAPLDESVVCHLEPGEARMFLAELTEAERVSWRSTAPGSIGYEARFQMACDLSRLRGEETRAVQRLAVERQIAEAEGWTPEPPTPEPHRGAPALRVAAQQEGPGAMGNLQDEKEVIEARQAGTREADEVTMAAIQHGRNPEWLSQWARDASAGLFGAAATDADRAFAAGFERQALSLTAEHAAASQPTAAPQSPTIPREYMSRTVQRLGEQLQPGLRDVSRETEMEAGQ